MGWVREEGMAYTLKRVAVERKAAMWLEKSRFMCGDLRTRCSGMMGFTARVSAKRKSGKKTAKMASEAITKG
jgi:hypothetical protein